ncbi:hypothetical protein ACGFJC_53585 [Nonomuraea fuscirosea]|uniref:hypothetical protein n=1 Tax=Nonomuraea fuscirosea TaxID=1291556 RepID=UPI0034798670
MGDLEERRLAGQLVVSERLTRVPDLAVNVLQQPLVDDLASNGCAVVQLDYLDQVRVVAAQLVAATALIMPQNASSQSETVFASGTPVRSSDMSRTGESQPMDRVFGTYRPNP